MAVQMKVYAVRQKSTGLFIPRFEPGKRRGGSHLEPSNERSPRLFHSHLAARAFLGNWLQGIFENDSFVGLDGVVECGLKINKQPHRKKEDMEIVEFNCFESNTGPVFEALQVAHLFGNIDGGHHRKWVIDQMVRYLTGLDYEAWVVKQKEGEDGPDTYDWSTGTPP